MPNIFLVQNIYLSHKQRKMRFELLSIYTSACLTIFNVDILNSNVIEAKNDKIFMTKFV